MRLPIFLIAAMTVVVPASGDVITSIYTTINSPIGGGAPYSGFVGTLTTPGISFATDTGYNWHPFGLSDFGADVIASLVVPTSGTYTFHLSSDDGSLVFIDGSLLIDRGGPHGPSTTDGTLPLTAGTHSVEIQFFECCGGPSGLDFSIPVGTIITSTPEPGSLALLTSGLVGTVAFLRRRKLR